MIQRYVVTHWFRLVSAHPHKTISQLARNQFDFPKGIFIQISCWHLVSVRTHRILFSFIPLFITLFNNQYNSSNSIGELEIQNELNFILQKVSIRAYIFERYWYLSLWLLQINFHTAARCSHFTSKRESNVNKFFADPLIPRLCTNYHKLCPLNRTSCRSWTS